MLIWALFAAGSFSLIGAVATTYEWLRTGVAPALSSFDRVGAACYFVNQGLLTPLLGLALGALGAALHPSESAPASAEIVGQFVFAFFAFEAVTYGYHRAAHRFRPLKRLHRVHHATGSDLSWLAGFRQHPVEFALMQGLGNLPSVLVFGASASVSLWLNVALRLATALLHARGELGLGVGEWLVMSPRLHHRHHGARSGASRKIGNFGGLVTMFDRAFGTLVR